MEYRKICVAVALQRYIDFTPVALRQRELARVLAGEYGSAVRVLSVNAPVALMPGVETTEDKLRRYVEPLREVGLDGHASKPLREDGLDVHASQQEGRPSREIARYVEEVRADLLIMGSHSKRGPLDVGLGSTAAALPVDLGIPVLLVRPTPDEQAQTRELAIPRYPFIFPYG